MISFVSASKCSFVSCHPRLLFWYLLFRYRWAHHLCFLSMNDLSLSSFFNLPSSVYLSLDFHQGIYFRMTVIVFFTEYWVHLHFFFHGISFWKGISFDMHASLHKRRKQNHRQVVFAQQDKIYSCAHPVLTNLLITNLLVLCFSQKFLGIFWKGLKL